MVITDAAQTKLKDLLAEEEKALYFRVGVTGGGCSGFSYGFSFDDTKHDDDQSINCSEFDVLVDAASWEYLTSSQIDFEQDLTGESFTITNPEADSSCASGTSFCPSAAGA